MTNSHDYDHFTLHHWLCFKLKCHECTATEFQSLFENIIKRAKPEFIAIKPYGNIGDRKCDGLLKADSTVFQIYSPDEIKLAKMLKKIREDFDGAFNHWQDMAKWTFVYNVRRGLAPDIPQLLDNLQKENPTVKIDHLSNDGLWELARQLTVQQRSEILSPPPAYQGDTLAIDQVAKQNPDARIVIVQDILSPVNLQSVTEALHPKKVFGNVFLLRPDMDQSWEDAAKYQDELVKELLVETKDASMKYAIFSFAPIPLVLHLGFLLSDRVEVEYFQFHRDEKTWRWPEQQAVQESFIITGLPSNTDLRMKNITIRISLSARISPEDTKIAASDMEIDIGLAAPSVNWLKDPAQLMALGKVFRGVLESLRQLAPQAEHIHLFLAGPTPAAVIVGQQINPRMDSAVETYEYHRKSQPKYQRALSLK